MKIKDLNKIKKFLGITKKELILLALYKQHGIECAELDEAIEVVLKLMEDN